VTVANRVTIDITVAQFCFIAVLCLSGAKGMVVIMEVNENVIDTVYSLLASYHKTPQNDDKTRRWIKNYTLSCAIRYLEQFCQPKISKGAKAKAKELYEQGKISDANIDLSKCDWDDQRTKMGDPDRDVFHYEHVYPVSQLRDKLIELSDPERTEGKIRDEIKNELKKVEIAWITIEENGRLDAKGYRSQRPTNPLDAYNEVNIELLP
jgi:hypothetical protein